MRMQESLANLPQVEDSLELLRMLLFDLKPSEPIPNCFGLLGRCERRNFKRDQQFPQPNAELTPRIDYLDFRDCDESEAVY